jgi:hypothetical protein
VTNIGRVPDIGRPAMAVVHECVAKGLGIEDTLNTVRERGYLVALADVVRSVKTARQQRKRQGLEVIIPDASPANMGSRGSAAPREQRYMVDGEHRPRPGSLTYWVVQQRKTKTCQEIMDRAERLGIRMPTQAGIYSARSLFRHLFDEHGRSRLEKLPPPREDVGRRSPGAPGTKAWREAHPGEDADVAPKPKPKLGRPFGAKTQHRHAPPPPMQPMQPMQQQRQTAPLPVPVRQVTIADTDRAALRAMIMDVGLKAAREVFDEFQHIRERVERT